ncbi:MAG: hypothetical protein CMH26_03530 [Micavibrio sp.]|nr:hypothetical protein [Micavibrio sp.]|tara:strand:+ start:244 stop:897 length:654 start_codon:yes stop_codon:yes gene_type:complete
MSEAIFDIPELFNWACIFLAILFCMQPFLYLAFSRCAFRSCLYCNIKSSFYRGFFLIACASALYGGVNVGVFSVWIELVFLAGVIGLVFMRFGASGVISELKILIVMMVGAACFSAMLLALGYFIYIGFAPSIGAPVAMIIGVIVCIVSLLVGLIALYVSIKLSDLERKEQARLVRHFLSCFALGLVIVVISLMLERARFSEKLYEKLNPPHISKQI